MTNEETEALKIGDYNLVYSAATEGEIGWLITEKIARHILLIKIICNQLLVVTIACSPKITVICVYVPTEEEISLTDSVTFHCTISLY